MYPDVKKSKLNPFFHYLLIGRKEQREDGSIPPKFLFFKEGYCFQNPDVVNLGVNPWEHYVSVGNKEGRGNGLVPKNNEFFAEGYVFLNPTVDLEIEEIKDNEGITLSLWEHYVLYGKEKNYLNGVQPPRDVFFKEGYLLQNHDIAKAKADPWKHYVKFGFKEGRGNGLVPKNNEFFAEGYVFLNPTVDLEIEEIKDNEGITLSLWEHYVLYGKDKNYLNGVQPPRDVFFKEGYLLQNHDIAKAKADPWKHYVKFGFKEGRGNGLVPKNNEFFAEGYVFLNPTVDLEIEEIKDNEGITLSLWEHYVLYGKGKNYLNGVQPPKNVFFKEGYLLNNPDVEKAKVDPWKHYVNFGCKEKRIFDLPFFDEVWYVNNYNINESELTYKGRMISPQEHYYFIGYKKGYNPSEFFDSKYYCEMYGDIGESNNPLVHYLTLGKSQHRRPFKINDLVQLEEVKTIEVSDQLLKKVKQRISDCYEVKQFKPQEISYNSILIVLPEHIGDIVAVEPIVRYLKNMYEGNEVYWLIKDSYVDLIKYNPYLDGFVVVNNLKDCYKVLHNLRKNVKILNLMFDGRKDKESSAIWYNSNRNIGFSNYLVNNSLLSAFSQLANIGRLDCQPIFWEKKEYVSLSKNDVFRQYLKSTHLIKDLNNLKFIAIHCAANDPRKSWSKENVTELAKRMLTETTDIILLDIGLEKQIFIDDDRVVDLTKNNNLQQIYQVVKNIDLFVGVDSSFMHFANCAKVKSIGIFGQLENFIDYNPYSGCYGKEEKIVFVRPYNRSLNAREVEIKQVIHEFQKFISK